MYYTAEVRKGDLNDFHSFMSIKVPRSYKIEFMQLDGGFALVTMVIDTKEHSKESEMIKKIINDSEYTV